VLPGISLGMAGSARRPVTQHRVRLLNEIRRVLLGWADRHDHLREVARNDVLAIVDALHGNKRRHTLCVLRSLFRHRRKSGTIFGDQPRASAAARTTITSSFP
jgi:hypothetical protein